MKRVGFVLVTISMVAFMGSCGEEGGATDTSDLALAFDALPQLGVDFVYEGWLITPDGAVSSGRFTVDAEGALSRSQFVLEATLAADSSAFVLTIEPATGDDPAPSDTHILAGDLDGNVAELSIGHAAAFGDDFSSAAGEYILAAPTGGEGAPFQNGIWWLIPGDAPSPGLSVPILPAGWAYEGWVASPDGPVSTGRFTDVGASDSDGAGPDAGSESDPPAFPGQDFVDPARDLTAGYMAVISVEPEPDDSPAPFFIKPLVHAIASVMPPATQTMDSNAAATSPSGTATITPFSL